MAIASDSGWEALSDTRNRLTQAELEEKLSSSAYSFLIWNESSQFLTAF